MKIITEIVFLLWLAIPGFSQNSITAYIELKVTIMGRYPNVDRFKKPAKLVTKADSLIDYQAIETMTRKYSDPVSLINALSISGWSLVTVTCTPRDEKNFIPFPTLLYYFKRDYLIE